MAETAVTMDLAVGNDGHSIAVKDMEEEKKAESTGADHQEQGNCFDDLEEINLSSLKRNGGDQDKMNLEAESRNQQLNGEVSDGAMARMEESRS